MENLEDSNIEILKQQPLFSQFTDDQLQIILRLTEKRKFDADETIIKEGDSNTEIYFIAEGEVKLLKLDEEGIFNLALGKLQAGDMFGEMSFMDGSPRSSTVETTKKTTVFELAMEKLDQSLPENKEIYNQIIRNIATININRLRMANTAQVKTLRTSLRKFQIKINWGKCLLFLIFICGLLNQLSLFFREDLKWMNPSLYQWVYWWILGLATAVLISFMHLYKDEFGVTTNNLKKTLSQSLGFIVAGGVALSIIPLFQTGLSHTQPLGWPWLGGYFLYCCAYEFVARGMMFSLFRKFLEDTRGWLSVFLSACLITLIPLTSMSFESTSFFLMFAFNLVMGGIYLFQMNLLGVVLIHFILGAYLNYLHLV